jgi:hypothetical protein
MAWINIPSTTHPSARRDASMACDPSLHKIVLYGGSNAAVLNDTWEFDINTRVWTNFTPGTTPGSRWYHTMCWDGEKVILIGGLNGSATPQQTTHSYNFTTHNWTLRSSTIPNFSTLVASNNYAFRAVYNPSDDLVHMFAFGPSLATWHWTWNRTTNTWTRLTDPTRPSTPTGLESQTSTAVGWDGEKIILYFGVQYIPPSTINLFNVTWKLQSGNWVDMAISAPGSRDPSQSFAGWPYMIGRGMLLSCAGPGGGSIGETWLMNRTSWADISPSEGILPARFNHCVASDGITAVVFGGQGSGFLSDTHISVNRPNLTTSPGMPAIYHNGQWHITPSMPI